MKKTTKIVALFMTVYMICLSPMNLMAANNADDYGSDIYNVNQKEKDADSGHPVMEKTESASKTSKEDEATETVKEKNATETKSTETTTESLPISKDTDSKDIRSQTKAKNIKSGAIVDGVMEIDVSAGPIVIVDEGFAQDTEDQHFYPRKEDVPTLDSFTAWTGSYRITGNFDRIQDEFTSNPIVRVLGGTENSPIEIELKDANLNNKKDDNVATAGSAIEIGGSGVSAVHMKLTGNNTAIGSAICSGVEVYDRAWLKISGDGSLEAVGGRGGAGIGGASQRGDSNGRTIIIDSGTIKATGGERAAGIGAGSNTVGGTIEINGGSITAQGGKYGAGIGAGLVYYDSEHPPLDIRINGGKIQAKGGEFGAGIGGGYAERNYTATSEISIQIGGTADVTAVGGKFKDWFGGAGIGAGYTYQTDSAAVNPNVVIEKIEINGGKVSATGADCAAGIGASPGNHVKSIIISDGNVTADGGTFASGIGTGYSWPTHPTKSTVGEIQISGGVVQATGMENSAGIGSSDYSEMGNIVIGGGEIHSQGGEFGPGIGSGARATVGDITVTAGNVTSRGGVNGAGIGTGWAGTAKDILISGGDVFASTDYVVEEGTIDGLAAGIGGGADGIVQAIKMSGTAEILAISGLESAGIGRGYRESVEVPIIPITIEGTPNITAYATGTADGKIPSKEISAIEYEGITSCSTNILQGHFKTVLDSENEKQFVVRGDSGADYTLNMPQNFQSFATTTSGTGIHKVYVDDALYVGSKEMNENTLTSKLQVTENSLNPYWYLQPATTVTVTFDSQGGSPIEAVKVPVGENVTKPSDPTKEGYRFLGWYKEASTQNAWNFADDTVDSDLTLYAGWSPIQYEVVFNKNSASAEGTMANQSFAFDQEKELSKNIFKNEGFEFAGWATSPTGQVVYSDKQMVKNLTAEEDGRIQLYAVWNKIGDAKYTIEHYKQNKDGTWPKVASDIETKSAKLGTTVSGQAKVYNGYVFDSTVKATVISGEVKADGSLALKLYYKVCHTVIFDSDGGNYTPDDQLVAHEDEAAEPKSPAKDGYVFEGWYYENEDGKQVKWNFGDKVTKDMKLIAHWKKKDEPVITTESSTQSSQVTTSSSTSSPKTESSATNTSKTGSVLTNSVKTGDTSDLILFFGLLAGSALMLTLVVVTRRKEKTNR